jgi:hypothetical protein
MKSNGSLNFKEFKNLKIGFSTQDFQKAMPVDVPNLIEIIEYASREGYQFVMIRDDLAKLSSGECTAIAIAAMNHEIALIYEIHKNPLDSGYFEIFEKALANTLLLPGPGIIRTLISKSEFESDPTRKGWSKEELVELARISEASATKANKKNIRFIVENFNEAFFGNVPEYHGLSDFFEHTALTGLQFDISNPFRNTSRQKSEPENVMAFLSALGNRWVTTHLKTAIDGEMQPVLTENPIPVEDIIALMAVKNIPYVALELAGVSDKDQCYENHALSIQFLKDKGILID